MALRTLDLTCDICGASCGQISVNANAWPGPLTKEALGIADQRCPSCEATHGTFKQLETEAYRIVNNRHQAFILAKQHRQFGKLTKELDKIKADRMKNN